MATRSEPEPHDPANKPDVACRRQFMRWLAGTAGIALLVRVAPAAEQPEAVGKRSGRPTPILVRSPGPDWERVPPSRPGGVGGWRNMKTGEFRTDWFPRGRRIGGYDLNGPSCDSRVLLRACQAGKVELRIVRYQVRRHCILSRDPNNKSKRARC